MKISISVPHRDRARGRGTKPVVVEVGNRTAHRLPKLGLCSRRGGKAHTVHEAELLSALRPHHLRLDIEPDHDLQLAELLTTADDAQRLGAGLELAIILSANPQEALRRLADAIRAARAPVHHVLVFHREEEVTPPHLVPMAREHLVELTPGATFAGGTLWDFAELNRAWPYGAELDAVAYGATPQHHGQDEQTLIEALEGLASTVQTARRRMRGIPVYVTPLTLRPRSSSMRDDQDRDDHNLPLDVDPRQMSLFGAGWTLGAVAAIAAGGAASATFFETTGWRGILESETGPRHERFPSSPGIVFPVYHVFADLLAMAGGRVLDVRVSTASPLSALVIEGVQGIRLLAANLTNREQVIDVRRLPGSVARLRRMDTGTAPEAMRRPASFREQGDSNLRIKDGGLTVGIGPYEVVRVDARISANPRRRFPVAATDG